VFPSGYRGKSILGQTNRKIIAFQTNGIATAIYLTTRTDTDSVIAAIWIYTYEAGNILTDVMLMALSFSIIYTVRIPLSQKVRISCLFNIGLVLVGISIARIFRGHQSTTEGGQTAYESMEILFSTIVAVTPTLYTLLKNKAEKRSSTMGTTDRVPSLAGSTYELEDALSLEDCSSMARIVVHVKDTNWGPGKSAQKT